MESEIAHDAFATTQGGEPVSADGQNPASKLHLSIHPSVEPYRCPESAYNAKIPIQESRSYVAKSRAYLGNAG